MEIKHPGAACRRAGHRPGTAPQRPPLHAPRSPLRFGDPPLAPIEPGGGTGRDNDAVYGDRLGLDAAEVAKLMKDIRKDEVT